MANRRKKGSGSIVKYNGRYKIRYKGITKYADTKTEAIDVLNDLIIAVDAESEHQDTSNAPTIKTAIEQWMSHKALTLKPTSLDRLEQTVMTHIVPRIGDMLCAELTEDLLIEKILQPMKAQGLSYSSVKKAQDAMCNFSRWASNQSRGYMERDPLASFEKITKAAFVQSTDDEDNEVVCLSAEERVRLAAACHAKYSTGAPRFKYGDAVLFTMYTGLRLGELLALTWDKVDFENKIIRVSAGMIYAKDRDPASPTFGHKVLRVMPYTKTSKPRRVRLGTQAFTALQRMYETKHPTSKYVVSNAKGELVLPATFELMLTKIFDLADIHLGKGRNVHALRHTFASMCFAKGMKVRVVSELLGHSSVQITMDTYIHLITEINLETDSMLDELL